MSEFSAANAVQKMLKNAKRSIEVPAYHKTYESDDEVTSADILEGIKKLSSLSKEMNYDFIDLFTRLKREYEEKLKEESGLDDIALFLQQHGQENRV